MSKIDAVLRFTEFSNRGLRVQRALIEAGEKSLEGKIEEAKAVGNSVAEKLEALAREIRDFAKTL